MIEKYIDDQGMFFRKETPLFQIARTEYATTNERVHTEYVIITTRIRIYFVVVSIGFFVFSYGYFFAHD